MLVSKSIPDSVVYGDPIPLNLAALFLVVIFINLIYTHLSVLRKLSSRSTYFLVGLFVFLNLASLRFTPLESAPLTIVICLGLCVALVTPLCGVAIFTSLLITRPWELSYPNPFLLMLPKMSAGIGILSWLISSVINGKVYVFWNSSCLIFVIWILWLSVTSLLYSDNPFAVFENLFPSATIAFLLFNVPKDLKSLALIRFTILTSIAFVITNAYYLTVTYHTLNDSGRLESIGYWSNSNDLGSLLAISLAIVISILFLRDKKRIEGSKVLALFLMLIFLVATWHTQSRATFLACGLSLGLAISFALPKQMKFLKIGLTSIILITMMSSTLLLSRNESDLAGSSTSRKAMIIAGLKMAANSPIFGVGFGQYPKNFDRYNTEFIETGEREAHNSWIVALAENGLPGLIIFSSLVITVWLKGWYIREDYPLLVIVFTGYLITMTFLSHTYLFLPYLVMGWVLGGQRVIENINRSELKNR